MEGISDVFISGQRDYSMRLWVDPEKLASRNLTPATWSRRCASRTSRWPAGGSASSRPCPDRQTQITLTTLGRLQTPEQFGDIILRSPPDGRMTRLRDVARVELGAKNDDVSARLDGQPSVGLIIFQLPDANALEMADRIHDKMEELAKDFPGDMDYDIEYDTTPYTRECIQEVFKALRDAIILVALVVLVFLQNWRSAVIPLIAVPVAIIGTFGVMAVMHFSLNNLTLFGLVLAIGIVVDDAIVVVEAVEHHIEHGLTPREATIKAMSQVSGPVIAVGLVLSAVFVPCAFISGITGQFFRQFALTIAVLDDHLDVQLADPQPGADGRAAPPAGSRDARGLATAGLSAGGRLDRLRLADAAAGVLVGAGWRPCFPRRLAERLAAGGLVDRRRADDRRDRSPAGWCAGRSRQRGPPPRLRRLQRGRAAEHDGLHLGGRRPDPRQRRGAGWSMSALLGVTYWDFGITPKGFIPPQDMGYLMVNVQLPDAASLRADRSASPRRRNGFA